MMEFAFLSATCCVGAVWLAHRGNLGLAFGLAMISAALAIPAILSAHPRGP